MGISKGLVAAYNKQVSGASWLDLTGKEHDIVLTNTTWVADGLGAKVPSARGNLSNIGNTVLNSQAGTVVFYFVSDSAFGDGINRRVFGNSASGLGQFYLYKNTSGFLYFSFYDTSYHYVSNKVATFPHWSTTGHQIAIVWDRSSAVFGAHNMIINVDGVHVTPFSSAGTTSWSSFSVNTDLGVLNDHVGTFYANGAMAYQYIFNKALTATELTAINANHNIILRDYFKTTGNYNTVLLYR